MARRRHPDSVNRGRWLRLRHACFEAEGWRCQRCGKAGRLELDHIRPIHQGGAWWDRANLQVLCRGCHFAKTRRELERVVDGRDAWDDYLARFT